MPPKKGKKGKGPKGEKGEKGPKGPKPKKLPVVGEGLHTTEMAKGQLMTLIKRLLAESEREIEEKNLFALEKAKLYNFWNLCIQKVQVLKEEARISETKKDKAEQARDAEKEYQDQKLRQLQNEELKNFGKVRLIHLNEFRKISNEIWDVENILRDAAIGKRIQIRTLMRSQYEILRSLHSAHAKTIQNMMFNVSKAVKSKETVWQRIFDSRRGKSTENVTKKDKLIIATKLGNLFMMNDAHERIFQDLKTFFNDMNTNNFAVITTLEQEIDAQKSTNNRLLRDLRNVKAHYVAVTKPLEKMQQELLDWKDHDQAMKRTIDDLKRYGNILSSKLNCENHLRILIELLLEKIQIASEDFQRVQSQFSKGVIKVQQKLSMENLVSQLKFKAARQDTTILEAIAPAVKHKDKSRLEQLQLRTESQLEEIKNKIDDFIARKELKLSEKSCSDLRQMKGTISPRILTPGNFPCLGKFQGKGQNIRSSLQYKGDKYEPKGSSRGVGYGFFHIPPSDLSPPPSLVGDPPKLSRHSLAQSRNVATSSIRFSDIDASHSDIFAGVPLHSILKVAATSADLFK